MEVAKDQSNDIIQNCLPPGQAITRSAISATSSSPTNVVIDPKTTIVVITVQDNPCFMAYDGNASATEFDEHLLDEQTYIISLPEGEKIGLLSFFGDGGTAVVRMIQKE